MISKWISHPTVVPSSRSILPYVEVIEGGSNIVLLLGLTHGKCVLLPKVAGDELVVVDGEQTPLPALAGRIHALPSVPTVGGCIPTSAKAGCG